MEQHWTDSLKEAIRQIVKEEITEAMANYPIIISMDEPLTRDTMARLVSQLKERLSHNVILTSNLGEITRPEVKKIPVTRGFDKQDVIGFMTLQGDVDIALDSVFALGYL